MICGNCQQLHDSVRQVRECYGLADEPATQKQKDYAHGLYRQRDPQGTVLDGLAKADAEKYINDCTKRSIQPVIEGLKEAPYRKEEKQEAAELTDGIYVSDASGTVYKFYYTQNGVLAAKELRVLAGAVWENGWLVNPAEKQWIYRGAAYRYAKGTHRLSKEEAAKFGKLYGFCMVCGRTLTDADSIAAGIGPVCAGKEGWA